MKILKFGASWCQPCKALTKTLQDVNLAGFELQEVDVEENQVLAAKYGIRNVPTMVMVDDSGVLKSISVGTKSKTAVEEWLSTNAVAV
jgi:thioredoxin-like negative regulator of GroEL